MQSHGNSFCGDVVLNIFNKASRDENNTVDQIYTKTDCPKGQSASPVKLVKQFYQKNTAIFYWSSCTTFIHGQVVNYKLEYFKECDVCSSVPDVKAWVGGPAGPQAYQAIQADSGSVFMPFA